MRKDLNAGGSLRAVMQQYHLALEQAICQLAQAVGNHPPERAEIVGMEYARTVIQNEEHWVVRVPEEHIDDIPPIGTELFALPIHVCPTSALYPSVPVVEKGHILDTWEVTARNRKINI